MGAVESSLLNGEACLCTIQPSAKRPKPSSVGPRRLHFIRPSLVVDQAGAVRIGSRSLSATVQKANPLASRHVIIPWGSDRRQGGAASQRVQSPTDKPARFSKRESNPSIGERSPAPFDTGDQAPPRKRPGSPLGRESRAAGPTLKGQPQLSETRDDELSFPRPGHSFDPRRGSGIRYREWQRRALWRWTNVRGEGW
jgi:hypothetical protein